MMLSVFVVACSDSKTPSPTAPSPTPTPTPTPPSPPPATYTLSGRVLENAFTPIPNATVTVADGPNAGKSETTDPGGAYKLTGLSASTFTLNVAATNYESKSVSVALTGDQSLDIQLTPKAK